MRKLMRITFAPCGEEWIVYKCSIQKLCNGGMREEKSKYKWKIKKVDNNSTDQNVQRRENWKAKRVGVHFNKTFVMKKFLIVGIISILACSANAASFQSEIWELGVRGRKKRLSAWLTVFLSFGCIGLHREKRQKRAVERASSVTKSFPFRSFGRGKQKVVTKTMFSLLFSMFCIATTISLRSNFVNKNDNERKDIETTLLPQAKHTE